MIPETVAASVNAAVVPGVTHISFVLFDVEGRLLVSRPKTHPYGVTATFPRLRIEPPEPASAALNRCISSWIALRPHAVYPLRPIWATGHSATMVFTGIRFDTSSKPPEALSPTEWCTVEAAKALFTKSPNVSARGRDLNILGAVQHSCVSPARRIFLMVHELHQMGFQRLRVAPAMSPTGFHWRCSVLPITLISERHGARIDHEALERFNRSIGYDTGLWTYSSSSDQEPFGWTDAHFDTPRELAQKFVQRVRELAWAGWGDDAAYARWYEEMLALTSPNGLFYEEAAYSLPEVSLLISMQPSEVPIPVPPPGHALAR